MPTEHKKAHALHAPSFDAGGKVALPGVCCRIHRAKQPETRVARNWCGIAAFSERHASLWTLRQRADLSVTDEPTRLRQERAPRARQQGAPVFR